MGVAVYEGTNAPYAYTEKAQYVDMLISPSNHSRAAFLNTKSIPKDTHVIPHGYNDEAYKPSAPKDKEFTVLFVGGWSQGFRDRRKLHIALKAFDTLQGDCKFIIKCSPYPFPEHLIKEMNLKNKNVLINKDYLTDSAMAEIYSRSHVIIEPTGAEGFCFPLLEGYACGALPITNVFGGQEELMKMLKMDDWCVGSGDYELANDEWGEGNQWFNPSQDDYGCLLRAAQEYWKKKTFTPKKNLLKKMTWKARAKEYAEVIENASKEHISK